MARKSNIERDLANARLLTGLVKAAKDAHFPLPPYGMDVDEEDRRYGIIINLPVIVMGRRRFPGLQAVVDVDGGKVRWCYLQDQFGMIDRPREDGGGVHPHVTGRDFCHASGIDDVPSLLNRHDYSGALALLLAIAGSSVHRRPGLWLCATCSADVFQNSRCEICKAYACNNHASGCQICGQRVCQGCQSANGAYCAHHDSEELVKCAGCGRTSRARDSFTCQQCQQVKCNRCLTRCGACRQQMCNQCLNQYSRCAPCQERHAARLLEEEAARQERWRILNEQAAAERQAREQARADRLAARLAVLEGTLPVAQCPTKRCSNPGCAGRGQQQPLSNFGLSRRTNDGLNNQCNHCLGRTTRWTDPATLVAAPQPAAPGGTTTARWVLNDTITTDATSNQTIRIAGYVTRLTDAADPDRDIPF